MVFNPIHSLFFVFLQDFIDSSYSMAHVCGATQADVITS